MSRTAGAAGGICGERTATKGKFQEDACLREMVELMTRVSKQNFKGHAVATAEVLLSFLNPGITNYEEYSLIQESVEEKKEEGMGTLKKDRTLLLRDERKMEKLKAKLHTDDDCEPTLMLLFDFRRHTSRLLCPF